jgi:predicted glycogen debranching enzyme
MSALTFDKGELGNLEYSLQREMLATDRRNGYMSTTIVCCNTRKYHGLMVAPIDNSDRTHVLLSSLDETIVQHDQSFNLALHRFNGVYEPRGHKYITDFKYTPCPTITYRVGGVILQKELLWIHKRTQLMIRYTLLDAHSETTLRLRPFFAFRDKHALTKANMDANGRSYPVPHGVKCRLYESYPWLYLQTDRKDAEFIPAPDWYYDFEYQQELKRGYDGYEDLMTTGYFELKIKKGESIIFSASTEEMSSAESIREFYETSMARRTHKIDFLSCLHHSARQFVVRRPENRTEMIAGYPWMGVDGRSTFIALPGITLEQGYKEDCIEILDTMLRDMRNGDFAGSASAYNAADAPLWFFWTLQNLEKHLGAAEIWNRYGEVMKSILEAYRSGIGGRVQLHENGLVWAAAENVALTWMNTYIDGKAQLPRSGYAVEIQALWYNAVCYTLALAKKQGDKDFVAEWKNMPVKTQASFIEKFWYSDEDYLYDYVNDHESNHSVRSNMIIACGLDYTMLNEEQIVNVALTVRQHLLTPRGLRTLSPRNPLYDSTANDEQSQQDRVRMNGAVWVWPLIFYIRCGFRLRGEAFTEKAQEILDGFNEDIQTYCIGSIGEYFDADPPFGPRGAFSSALSVGALLQISEIIASKSKGKAKKSATKSAATKAATKATAKPAAKKSAKATTTKVSNKKK